MNAPVDAKQLKVPPHSIEAEQSVLGGLMLESKYYDDVCEVLSEGDFYLKEHRIIFNAMSASRMQSKPIDTVILADFIEATGRSDELDLPYLGELSKNTPSTAHIIDYAKIVHDRARSREVIAAANKVAEKGFDMSVSASEKLDFAAREFSGLSALGEGGSGKDPLDILKRSLAEIEERTERFNSGELIHGLPVGIDDLDRRLGGLRPKDLVIVAGRPAMGKSVFGNNFAEANFDKKGAIFSLEMGDTNIVQRMIASVGRVDYGRIYQGNLTDDDYAKMSTAFEQIKTAKLRIDDQGGLTINQVKARARRIAKELNGLDYIIVDYLQLMTGINGAGKRLEDVSEMSRELKSLAKELDCVVMALSQLNRGLEQRQDKRPKISDLRESGQLEQDADIILMLYREEVYQPNNQEIRGLAEVGIAKGRNVAIGAVNCAFIGNQQRFANLAPSYADDY